MGCNDKHTNICVDNMPSNCLNHEGQLGANTKITNDCVNQFDVNEDLYTITDEIIQGLDISELSSSCINIPLNPTVAEIITLYETKICEMDAEITALQDIDYANIDITGFGLTIPDCIADSCANPPITLAEWMQVMMDQRNCT